MRGAIFYLMDKFKLAYNRDLGNWTKQHLLPDMQQTSLKIFFDPGTYAFVYASRRPTPSDNVLPHTAPVESTFEEAPTLPSRKVFQNFFGVWGLVLDNRYLVDVPLDNSGPKLHT